MSGRVDRMKVLRFLTSLAVVVLAVAAVFAQTGKPGGTPAASTGTTATTATTTTTSTTGNVQQSLEEILEEPQGADTYRYDPQGRRDPFRSLVGPAPKIQEGQRPPGVPGFLIDEIKLTGIVR